MNQNNKLIDKIKSDTFLHELGDGELKFELKNKILNCYNKRIYNNMSQNQIAEYTGLSISTIKRIEKGQLYDIRKIARYISRLNNLKDREVKIVPKWI